MAKNNASLINYHRFDLPANLDLEGEIAVDTETLGLNILRDRLCCVQVADAAGSLHVVHFPEPDYDAPNLRALLQDEQKLKILHYARFDIAVLRRYLSVFTKPLFCTKIASRLVRTYSNEHGLATLCREIAKVTITKTEQSSYWGASSLSKAQLEYAANDVKYLHTIKAELEQRLHTHERIALAKASFAYLPVRAELDLLGWQHEDIFSHSS